MGLEARRLWFKTHWCRYKMAVICRRHFKTIFMIKNCILMKICIEICLQGSDWQSAIIGSDNDLVPNRRQAIICISGGLVYWCLHDDVIKWKHFPRNWPFVREIHRSPVNFPHKGQWRGALMFSLIYAWINDWVNNREAGDLRRQHGHYDVIVM